MDARSVNFVVCYDCNGTSHVTSGSKCGSVVIGDTHSLVSQFDPMIKYVGSRGHGPGSCIIVVSGVVGLRLLF